MRIVIDMQGAQTESRFRGIGRHTIGFSQAVVRNNSKHEVFLVLNGLFPETIEPIRAAFDGLLPQENIRVWHAPGPVKEEQLGNESRREVAELLREFFIASLQPDVVHIISLFEGYVDDAVTSIGRFDTNTPVCVTFYDAIPLLNPDHYLNPNPSYAKHYLRKLGHLKKACGYLTISESSRQECIQAVDKSELLCVNGTVGLENYFKPILVTKVAAANLRDKFGLRRPFILYTGGADERKNLPRLVEAFAALPLNLRSCYQLLFVGKIPFGNVAELKQAAQNFGLGGDELCFTGYVSDEEIVQLYNLCELYVFPSWHEGFGLPALEAMACGAPVIGANTSSLPEIIGRAEALFDPFDIAAIAQKIAQVLQDEVFRNQLRADGLLQAKKFSWERMAKQAIKIWEKLANQPAHANTYLRRTLAHNQLIEAVAETIGSTDMQLLSDISCSIAMNEKCGIERQLFIDVSELCQRDARTGVQRVVRNQLKFLLQSPPPGFRVEPVYATLDRGYHYARSFTLGFIGENKSDATDEPLQWGRGDLFFGLDMQHHVQLKYADFYRKLWQSGVTVKFMVHDLLPIQLPHMFKDISAKQLHERLLAMIVSFDGAICVSKATADALEEWVADNAIPKMSTFELSCVHNGGDIECYTTPISLPDGATEILHILKQRITFLCVSTIEPRKRQDQILGALEKLWTHNTDINLAFVGQQGWGTEQFAESLRNHPETGQRLFWFEGISDKYLENIYAASTCLIAASINEGFGLSLVESAHHGLPIIARDIPVFREVAGNYAYYFHGDSPDELADAIKSWLLLHEERKHPQSNGMLWITWKHSAEKLKQSLVGNCRRKQLLVDISELVQRDIGTGIQRVVRNIVKEWLLNPPEGYRVEPVYAKVNEPYHYARSFAANLLDFPENELQDSPITHIPGDLFVGLDLQPQVVVAQRAFYQALRRQGVKVKFVVYDLLCVLKSQHFVQGTAEGFTLWLEVVAESDGALCISQSVAREFRDWIDNNASVRYSSFNINWFHLGADIDRLYLTKGLASNAERILEQLKLCPVFLMVGSLEPRKAHTQVLDAFEQLWELEADITLVIVGKQGWLVEQLVERLYDHQRCGKSLFWLEDISDEYLDKIYAASTCLIAASEGEGFGLPLIEAAKYKLPIIARDIPVFREVAGEYAFYFENSKEPQIVAEAILRWLELNATGKAPQSTNMPWLTWRQSAQQLMDIVISGER